MELPLLATLPFHQALGLASAFVLVLSLLALLLIRRGGQKAEPSAPKAAGKSAGKAAAEQKVDTREKATILFGTQTGWVRAGGGKRPGCWLWGPRAGGQQCRGVQPRSRQRAAVQRPRSRQRAAVQRPRPRLLHPHCRLHGCRPQDGGAVCQVAAHAAGRQVWEPHRLRAGERVPRALGLRPSMGSAERGWVCGTWWSARGQLRV